MHAYKRKGCRCERCVAVFRQRTWLANSLFKLRHPDWWKATRRRQRLRYYRKYPEKLRERMEYLAARRHSRQGYEDYMGGRRIA